MSAKDPFLVGREGEARASSTGEGVGETGETSTQYSGKDNESSIEHRGM
jgi:hypothetical protein